METKEKVSLFNAIVELIEAQKDMTYIEKYRVVSAAMSVTCDDGDDFTPGSPK